jgi:transposase
MGRRGYPPEFRRKVLDLIDAGRKVTDIARDLGISRQTIYIWRKQHRIDQGLDPGLSSGERAELLAARRRIVQLETELKIARRATELLSGLVPSMGSIGDCYDNAMIGSFWSRMQVELLDRQRWSIRVELANAIFEYLEVFHNRQRRHSALQMLTPIEFEQSQTRTVA